MSTTYPIYRCKECDEQYGYLAFLGTGNFFSTPDHLKSFDIHTHTKPNKPLNGVFLQTGTGFYLEGFRQFGVSGFVEIESTGHVNAYLSFDSSIGAIEQNGSGIGDSSLGKAVLLNFPAATKWYPSTGFSSPSGHCADCGKRLW